MVKKIVITGPESTGKSVLSKLLAESFNTIHCPEYAREYLSQNGIKYTYNDLLKIAQGQLVMEDYCESVVSSDFSYNKSPSTAHSSLLFIDTDMYVMKVWYEYVFGKCEQFVIDEIAQRKYDLYLLCNIDLPWVAESMREYPDLGRRQELYGMYKDILINQQTPWVEISGDYDERLQKAIDAVQKYVSF